MTPTVTRSSVQAALARRLGSPHEARWMVEEVLGRPGPGGAVVERAVLDRALVDRLEQMAARRSAGEPLQYVLGTWAFRSLELQVDRRALIPRPETEQVVDAALAEARRIPASSSEAPLVVCDLGTGSGAVALSLAVELVEAPHGFRGAGRSRAPVEVWATDADANALALATANRARVEARHPKAVGRVRFRRGVWFGALPPHLAGRIGLVVANPPYVSEAEWETLDLEVRAEPRTALVAGPASDGTPGMGDVEAVLRGAVEWLAPGGAAVVELAPHQAGPAAAVAAAAGYVDVRVVPDLAGRDRAVVGRR